MITLFEIVTLEGWVEIYRAQPNFTVATIYFLSFIVLGTMIILNLFIGVVLNGFDEVKKELEETHNGKKATLSGDLAAINRDMERMHHDLKKLMMRYWKIDR